MTSLHGTGFVRSYLVWCVLWGVAAHGANFEFSIFPNGVMHTITPLAITTDAAGNVYMAGTVGPDEQLVATAGAFQTSGGGSCGLSYGPHGAVVVFCSHAFVMKVSAQGLVVWSTYLASSGDDRAYAIAVDPAGNVYVGGTTGSSNGAVDFPTTPGAAFRTTSAAASGFVAKLNPSGSALVYSTLVPGIVETVGIALDAAGAVYVCGVASASFAATAGAYQTLGGPSHAAVAKLSPDGSGLVYATFLGGSGTETAAAIAVDPAGSAYVAGSTTSSDFPTSAGAFQSTNRSKPDSSNIKGTAFVAKLNPTGTALLYSTLLGGSGNEYVNQILVDPKGNAILTGATSSSDFPVSSGAFQSIGPRSQWISNGTFTDALYAFNTPGGFVSKLNAAGSELVYSTYFGGVRNLALDVAGNAYVVGFATAGFPVTTGAVAPCYGGGGREGDAFVARLDSLGSLAEATYLGGSGDDYALATAVSADGSIYVAGATNSPDFPRTPGAGTGVPDKALVAFLSRFHISSSTPAPSLCTKLTIENTASYAATGSVSPGELVTIRGAGLGPSPGVEQTLDANGMVPTALAGTRVFFNEVPAPLLYVSDRQINAVVPFEVVFTGLQAQVRVERNGTPTAQAQVYGSEAEPAVFYLDYSSSQGAILNEDGTINSPSNPAKAGSVVSVFGTGGGATTPATVTGSIVSGPPRSIQSLPMSAGIGLSSADVTFAGSAPGQVAGVLQVNLRVPANLTPSSNWVLTMQTPFSAPSVPVTIAVK
jgi:uncharacterized protein (TIGR03437 family)